MGICCDFVKTCFDGKPAVVNMENTLKLKIFSAILGFLIAVSAGYLAYKNFHSPKISPAGEENISQPEAEKPLSNNSQPQPKIEKSNLIEGFKLYKNSDFGFEIQYPDSWMVSEEDIVNVRGENTKGFFFKKPNSDLRFAILPRDGLSYGLPNEGTSENINISGFMGVQTKYIMPDGRRLLLVHPQTNIFNWDQEIGRLDIESSVGDPVGDFVIFNKMLNSFKLSK